MIVKVGLKKLKNIKLLSGIYLTILSQAVYHYIPNPLETLPFIPKCEFEIGGSQDFIGEQNKKEEDRES
jgi:hypothetical protein